MVMFSYYIEDGKKRTVKKRENGERYYTESEIVELREAFFRAELPVTVWSKTIRRSVLLRGVYDIKRFAKLMYSEDRLQTMWVLNNLHSAAYADIPLYLHRCVAGSVTRNYTVDSIDKLNYSIQYQEEMFFAKLWRLEGEEWIRRIQAHYAYRVGETLSRFYLNVKPCERREVLAYPWERYIPSELTPELIRDNPFMREHDKQMFTWIYQKDYDALKRQLKKKRVYLTLRKIKRAFIPPRER